MTKQRKYHNYTVDQLSKMEDNYYCLRLGGDLVQVEGHFVFTKQEIAHLYNDFLNDLVGMMNDGPTKKDRETGLQLIGTLRIEKFRLH
jgi:hypothetical protein